MNRMNQNNTMESLTESISGPRDPDENHQLEFFHLSTEKAVSRSIRAVHTATTVRVYQAYSNAIADAVLEGKSFRSALERGLWSVSRMTWIKPSKVWMAYRCGWTVLKDKGQARVLALDLDRTKFEELLAQGILSRGGSSKKKCRDSAIVIQWDPERRITTSENGKEAYTQALPHTRSIQIGLRPPANSMLLDPSFVVGITDVTSDFQGAVQALQKGQSVSEAAALLWPGGQTESILQVPKPVELKLTMTQSNLAEKAAPDAVIVLGCTANPPHQGHFHCLKAAKVKAEQLGYNVIWTTIAVAPFGYATNKMKRAIAKEQSVNDTLRQSIVLTDDARIRVLQIMANACESPLRFLMPTRTYGSALECGRNLRPSPNVKVIAVVGGDRFNWSKRCHPDLVTLGCARDEAQYTILNAKLEEGIQQGLVDPEKFVLTSSVGPKTSSTLVREIMASSELSETQKLDRLLEEGYSIQAANALMNIDTSVN